MTNLEKDLNQDSADDFQFPVAPEAMTIIPGNNNYTESNTRSFLQEGLGNFARSINEILVDITALEVNTMLVGEIKGYKFVAEEAYQDIYFCFNSERKIPKTLDKRLEKEISKLEYLQGFSAEQIIPHQFRYNRENIKSELSDSNNKPKPEEERDEKNWILREKLRREYCQIYSERTEDNVTQTALSQNTKLPFPYALSENGTSASLALNPILNQYVLKNSHFLRSLRKLKELKAAVDTDSKIYAQTVIQLDGDMINRYRQDLFDAKTNTLDRDLLIDLHNRSVIAGEKQWRGLLHFCVNIVRDLVSSRRNDF